MILRHLQSSQSLGYYLASKFFARRPIFVLFYFISLSVYSQIHKGFIFNWDEQNNVFILDGDPSPNLVLFEHCFYKFTFDSNKSESVVGNFAITDEHDSIYQSDEIFKNSINGGGEYILFKPDENTPRSLLYQNLRYPSNKGNLIIKPYENKGILKSDVSSVGTNLGYDLVVTSDKSIFAGGPGFNDNEGLIFKFLQNEEGNYSFDKNINSPVSGSVFWGASIFHENNSSNLLIGNPNADNYSGVLYNYSITENTLSEVSKGSGTARMHGWSSFAVSGKTFVGELSALDALGGSVSIYSSYLNSPDLIHEIKSPLKQFGNEFGYSVHSTNDYFLVGVPGEDDLIREDSGAVYLYDLDDFSNSSIGTKILPFNRNIGARFGEVVWATDDFIFVGAPNGDGSSANCGVVNIFHYDKNNSIINEVDQLEPPIDDSASKFGQDIQVLGDFVFISSPHSKENGVVYIYRKSESATSWKHVNSIIIDEFSEDLSRPEKISLSVNNGILAIGLIEESSIVTAGGAVLVLLNPAWNRSDVPKLHPFFDNNDITNISAEEDQIYPVKLDFNASLPSYDSTPITWSIKSKNNQISTAYFDINSTSGSFIFNLPKNLAGNCEFEVTVTNGINSYPHDFNVSIENVADLPVFLDFNDSLDTKELPLAMVGEPFNYSFNTFDADDDILSIILNTNEILPNGLSINENDLSISGTPSIEGNYTFTLTLTDNIFDINKTFSLKVIPSKTLPTVSFRGNNITSEGNVSLTFKENFSLTDWQKQISDLMISDFSQSEFVLKVFEEDKPKNGYLYTTPSFSDANTSIKYFPNLNFHGEDNFTIRLTDNDKYKASEFILHFNVIVESLNSPPIIVSEPPASFVTVGNLYNHEFEIFDAEGDLYNITFEEIPEWISFDGIRTIRGVPKTSDITSVGRPDRFVVLVTDEESLNNPFSQLLEVNVAPADGQWPPSIVEGKISRHFSQEDVQDFKITLHTSDYNESSDLIWEISTQPPNGISHIIEQNSSAVTFSYTPDGNFSGIDNFIVSLSLADDSSLFYETNVEIVVEPLSDSPIFGSQPYRGVVIGKPFTLEILGVDGDVNDKLILKKHSFPSWLKIDTELTTDRKWVFRGIPSNIEDFDLNLELSDGNSSVFQRYTLEVVSGVGSLEFLSDIPQEVEILEDVLWELDENISVNSIPEIKVNWEIDRMPEYGAFSFDNGENGTIRNLRYLPDKHFYGTDYLTLEVSDGYSVLEHTIKFTILDEPDAPVFNDFPPDLIEEESEVFDLIIEFEDGDGINTSNLTIQDLPYWLSTEVIEETSFTRKTRIFGIPTINDIGDHKIDVNVSGKYDGLFVSDSFTVRVNYLNRPPEVWPSELFFEVLEDSSQRSWNNFISAVDFETDAQDLQWSIHENAKNGNATLSTDGQTLSYIPRKDFSGEDIFTIRVTDKGGRDYSNFRHTLIPVSIQVNPIEDFPFFLTTPPSDSNASGVFTWNDEKFYEYEIIAFDADWETQGYPSLSLRSVLPSWAKWTNKGNGHAVISGSPKWYHEGNYSFSIFAESGMDEISQDYVLQIVVDDYPPRIFDQNGNEIIDKVKVFILEDNHQGEVNDAVMQLKAFNPDPNNFDNLSWKILKQPTSGANLVNPLQSAISEGYSEITDFDYTPPQHFFGIDTFVLLADEGDRFTEVPIEVHIKSVQDPPEFNSEKITLQVDPNEYLNIEIAAYDPDIHNLEFWLLYPSGSAKWISVESHSAGDGNFNVFISGVVPPTNANGLFTLVSSDPTGRFSLLPIEITYH